MNDQPLECPICHLDSWSNRNLVKILERKDYDEIEVYGCKRCGKFSISRFARRIDLPNDSIRGRLSGWIREQNLTGKEPELKKEFLEHLIETLQDYDHIQKQNALLESIQQMTEYPSHAVVLNPTTDCSLAWTLRESEFMYYINSLSDRKLIHVDHSDYGVAVPPNLTVVIGPDGWDYLSSGASVSHTKTQVFVAMSFHESLESVYKNAIAPAIKETKYKPYRVDMHLHNEQIDQKIMAEIKNSRFLVADMTQQNNGVYFEAGFAKGFDIPVIWCVRKDELKNVHFDTRQFRHIVWNSEEELRDKLINSIRAIIS